MTGPSEHVRRLQGEIARRAQVEEHPQEDLAVLAFALASERYALPLDCVREVDHVVPITPIPGLPPAVPGAIGLRGQVLPVVDLRRIFRLEEEPLSRDSRLIVVQDQETTAALLVDRVDDISHLPLDDLRPPPARTDSGPVLLTAVTGKGDETIRLIDLAELIKAVRHG